MNSTYNYDYNYVYNESDLDEQRGPCSAKEGNYLGAQLSNLYYFIFLLSGLGNMLVLFIIYRFERLTTVTNIFLLNMVVSSLILISSLPFLAVYMQRSFWIFGDEMCRIVSSAYHLGFYSSILFLTLLTFDRHLAVVYALTAPQMRTQRYALLSSAVVWLVSFLACIPQMILHRTYVSNYDQKTYCDINRDGEPTTRLLTEFGFYIQFVLSFLFPLAVILYCYIRIAITVISSKLSTKFKTVRLIFIIVLLFFISWAPINIVQLMKPKTCDERKKLINAYHITHNFAYFYFCISPIFYTFVGKKFQNYFRQLLVNRFPRLKRTISVSRTSTSTRINL
ncbi:hypothetical protein PAMP_011476 [Pampus punctatissimus]